MRRARRPVAILMSLVLAQLMLIVGGYACVMRSGSSAAGAMAGMSMPRAAAVAPANTSTDDDAPCQFPWAPGGCQGMAPCAPAALVVAAAAPDAPGQRIAESIVTRALLAPASISLAPELPPPRA